MVDGTIDEEKMKKNADEIKMVVVGDGGTGKTCMVQSQVNDKFPTEYIPTVFDVYRCIIKVKDLERKMVLWDTAGQSDLAPMRKLSYPETSVFLVCFSLTDPISYNSVAQEWIPDLTNNKVGDVPKILVGLKSDMRAEWI